MNKPLTILKEELTQNIVNLINNSELPFFIVNYVIKDIANSVELATKQEEEQIKQQYENSLKKEEEINESTS